ncbi:sigma-54 dependent transcriptional regulator [Alkalimonas sp. MEB004]|uniref:Sigma-54 dependent transcriptional regulator n=2 Tax=Alkalimonas mucilaginosa TaxID=3057676 RepID=A0ABU7JGR1_9GAMM|nr:sigma-54 dependent transcriptional regulator [Alkalimonas sp. MEB004]
MNVLISWLGKTDIEKMKQNELASIATLATRHTVSFDEILILANAWEEDWQSYEDWLNKRLHIMDRPATASIVHQSMDSPTNYQAIAAIMQRHLEHLSTSNNRIYINLTSGTPAMTAISVLFGKGIYDCRFLQSGPDNSVEEVHIPFDFAATYARVARTSISAKVMAGPDFNGAFNDLVAQSASMQVLIQQASRLALTDLPALILGESGTGKEVLATAIHAGSSRSAKVLKTINCGALPENLVDSILFGHVKGAFTGADKEHAGLFEQANGGTLFLDEVGELTPAVQVKLLRVLQQGEITRVGDSKTRRVDVRILAATHRPLISMVADGTFREDLFYRLAVGVIELPPLRQRREDIPVLVSQILAEINATFAKIPDYQSKKISDSAINFIKEQPWPGNIRALWNTLSRAVLWAKSDELSLQDIAGVQLQLKSNSQDNHSLPPLVAGFDVQQYIDGIKEKIIVAALEQTGGNLSKSAKLLGLANHQTLSNWMKKLEIKSDHLP